MNCVSKVRVVVGNNTMQSRAGKLHFNGKAPVTKKVGFSLSALSYSVGKHLSAMGMKSDLKILMKFSVGIIFQLKKLLLLLIVILPLKLVL